MNPHAGLFQNTCRKCRSVASVAKRQKLCDTLRKKKQRWMRNPFDEGTKSNLVD
jgi:hypothetical protein